ncbi:putative ribonuclease H-like domain-containing protein [Tanacetum coccineum]
MHTFYQHHPSGQRWTKDHPLEQVIGNPSQSIRTRRQLETDGEMCMFTLTVSRTEPKNIKEAMAKAMQEELHQFDRLDVWELVDRPLCKNVINMKWLWKTNVMKRILLYATKLILLVSWSSKKQDCTSMSLTEAEYVPLFACYAQVQWLRTQLTDYGFHFDKIPMYCDSKAAIAILETDIQEKDKNKAKNDKTEHGNEKSVSKSQNATSAESFNSIFNRLQKIVSRLAILGVIIAQEDLNLKFLSSLPPEWNTHVVVWMNKPEIETISIDDLYNKFKIVEQKIKKTVGTSSGGQNLAFMTAPSSSSTNDANTTSSQDLEQIHEDDLEAMDLKWQLSLLSVRAKKNYQKTGKKIFINGNDIAGYDKSKVECYNCHKLGHFARECRASRSKEDQFRNQDNTRKQRNKEDTSKAMLAIDGVGFDWSDMAEEQKQYDDLVARKHETEFKAITYKRGLDTVEAQLVTYRKNEVLFSEEVDVLKREVGIKQYEIKTLKKEFGKLKQEKDAIDFKIEKFVPPPHPLFYNRPNKLDLSYSGLDEFKEPKFKGYGHENSKKESNVGCEKESDNSKENSDKSLVKEQESQVKSSFVEGCGSNTSKSVSEVEPKKVRENNDAPIIEEWVSDDEEQDESKTKPEKKTVIPTAAKIEKPVKKSVRYAEMYRSQSPRGNQRNWNGQKSNQLEKLYLPSKEKGGKWEQLQQGG